MAPASNASNGLQRSGSATLALGLASLPRRSFGGSRRSPHGSKRQKDPRSPPQLLVGHLAARSGPAIGPEDPVPHFPTGPGPHELCLSLRVLPAGRDRLDLLDLYHSLSATYRCTVAAPPLPSACASKAIPFTFKDLASAMFSACSLWGPAFAFGATLAVHGNANAIKCCNVWTSCWVFQVCWAGGLKVCGDGTLPPHYLGLEGPFEGAATVHLPFSADLPTETAFCWGVPKSSSATKQQRIASHRPRYLVTLASVRDQHDIADPPTCAAKI